MLLSPLCTVPRRDRHFKRSRRAFSMIELAITVLILGILASVTGPRLFEAMEQAQTRGAARSLIADIERVRQHAMNTATPHELLFDETTNSYASPGMPDPDHPNKRFEVELAATAYPAEIIEVRFGSDGTAKGISFNALGRPNHGGRVHLRVNQSEQSIQVDSVTGRAELWP